MAYVLITGASSGLGAEFAKQLAAEGRSLILVARREDKLKQLADELSNKHKVDIQVIIQDLTGARGARALIEQLDEAGFELEGLINNAGFGDRGRVTELPLDRQLAMIDLNVTCLMALTWHVMPRIKDKSGAFLINVASTAAFQPGPYLAVYYASKAFVLSFTEALHEEYRGCRVKISALCPGPTETEFAKEANMEDLTLFKKGVVMSAEDVVSTSLKKRDNAVVIPGFLNLIMMVMGKVSPRAITRWVVARLQK